MDTEQFRRVIENGLGRAVLYLRDHPWRPHAQAIEHVCLHSTAYDLQCEGGRAGYVYEIVRLTDDPQYFASITAKGLLETQAFWDADHLFDLAALFAKAGDAQAREAMYEKFRRNDIEREPFVGDEQIVSLDGVNGLLFVTDRIGQWLETNPCSLDDRLLWQAKDELGADVERTMREAAEGNANIRRYLAAVDEGRQASPVQRTDYHNLSYPQLRERIFASDGAVPLGSLLRWGKHASDEALSDAAADLLREDHEKRLIAYLRIFGGRPFPLAPQRLVELARSSNSDTAHASRRALRHVADASVRALALELIAAGQSDGDVVKLLARNYADGDHRLMESLLDREASEDDFHWTAQGVVEVFEANPDAEALPSMLQIYERSRSSICRNGAVEVLMQRRVIPAWMLEECRHDAYEHTREAAKKYAEQALA